jgi:hypothetical protein
MHGSDSILPEEGTVLQGAALFDVGRIHHIEQKQDGIYLRCQRASVVIQFLQEQLFRVIFNHRGDADTRKSDSVVEQMQRAYVPVDIKETETEIVCRTGALQLRIQRAPLRLHVYDGAGKLVHKDHDGLGLGW